MLEIITYPNPLLKKKSQEIEQFDKTLGEYLDAMYETMLLKEGVGLAAVQTSWLKRALLVNIPDENGVQHRDALLEIINPKIINCSGEAVTNEGCLSVPGFYEDVTRYGKIELEYYDRSGKKQNLIAEDFLAIALQHEIDHLEGRLFIEKLPMMKRKKFEKELKKKLRAR